MPGDGEINFQAVIDELDRVGYAGHCALELEGVGETLGERRERLRRAISFLFAQTDRLTGLGAIAIQI